MDFNSAGQLFLVGVALIFIFEGILPFLSPKIWRRVMLFMIIKNDRSLRLSGGVSMILGLALLYLVH